MGIGSIRFWLKEHIYGLEILDGSEWRNEFQKRIDQFVLRHLYDGIVPEVPEDERQARMARIEKIFADFAQDVSPNKAERIPAVADWLFELMNIKGELIKKWGLTTL